MQVLVVGAGQVGSNIARSLADAHEVVVIDKDPERVEAITYRLDVLAIEGDGTSLATLEEAGVENADMFIASTNSDEANMVSCATAKTVSDAFTVARVRKTDYLTTWRGAEGAFGVDFMVCTDLLAAETIVRIAGLPGAQDVDSFAGGRVRMAVRNSRVRARPWRLRKGRIQAWMAGMSPGCSGSRKGAVSRDSAGS